MSDVLTFEGVVKRFRGAPRPALDGLSFRVPKGAVCGLVGPNGAGKTTAFSVAAGFLVPDEGQVVILGDPGFDPWRHRARVGVLPQDAELPDRHPAVELLTHLARLQGANHADASAEARRCLERVGLADRADDRIGSLSHGMRRRVAVATALLGDPELLLVDEPTAGLDPIQTRGVREILSAHAGDRTVVVSSHNLTELERLCDWVVVLEQGRCVRQGTVEEVTGRGVRASWRLTAPLPAHAALPAGVVVAGSELFLQAGTDAALDAVAVAVVGLLAQHGVGVREVRRGSSLEDAVLEGR